MRDSTPPASIRPPPDGVLTRAVFLRALAVTWLVALVSLWVQVDGLIGSDGILPFPTFLDRVASRFGLERYWMAPTALWLWPTDAGLHACFSVGLVLGVAVLIGTPIDGFLLLGMWACYLSITTVGQNFLTFQWDSLLIESLLCAALLARWLPGPPRAPPRWALWLLWWVVFKLFFFGGLVKLTSHDPTWRDGTALTYHYWTQPLPNPVSWYADRLPGWFQRLSVQLMFVIELIVPFAIAAGPLGRRVAFPALVGLLGLLALTGNYGWFQLLGAVLCLTLIDDDAWRRILPDRALVALDRPVEPARHVGLPIAPVLVATSLMFSAGFDNVPGWAQTWMRWTFPFHTANTYGLFARMTTDRPVVVFEVSDDNRAWRPLWLPHQTGPVERMPGQVAPHMPRLDWQMWFAALGDCRRNGWVVQTELALARGEPAVWALFEGGLPASGPPRHVRTTRWQYRFAPRGSEDWWVRTPVGGYCPAVEAPSR